MTDKPDWYIVPKALEDTPRFRLERAERILDDLSTPAREARCQRLRFVIKKMLEGEPSKEQADSVSKSVEDLIWNK